MAVGPQPNEAADAAVVGAGARALGVSGTGVKIGIISDSFDNLAQGVDSAKNDTYQDDVQAGYLPGNIQVLADSPPAENGQYTGTDEGLPWPNSFTRRHPGRR